MENEQLVKRSRPFPYEDEMKSDEWGSGGAGPETVYCHRPLKRAENSVSPLLSMSSDHADNDQPAKLSTWVDVVEVQPEQQTEIGAGWGRNAETKEFRAYGRSVHEDSFESKADVSDTSLVKYDGFLSGSTVTQGTNNCHDCYVHHTIATEMSQLYRDVGERNLELEGKVSNLERDNHKLEREVEWIMNSNAGYKERINQLKRENRRLRRELEQCDEEKRSLEQEVVNLKNQVEQYSHGNWYDMTGRQQPLWGDYYPGPSV